MRKTFFQELYKQMKKNPNIYAVTGDLGYIGFDKIRDEFPDRFINTGASEFSMMGIAVGLAQEGKIPFVYSITPFLLYRPFEMLRTYINHEKIPVRLVGSGRNDDYKHDGFSHDATDAKRILDSLTNIQQLWPEIKEEIPLLVSAMVAVDAPQFINLTR